MDLKSSIILGIVQGFTEFLPISSSAHLVFIPKWLNLTEPDLAFDILLHLSTLLAVVIYFRKEVYKICIGFVKSIKILFQDKKFAKIKEEEALYMPWLIIIASIPTAFLGFCFEDYFENLFNSVKAVGCFLIITGFILWFGEKMSREEKDIKNFSILDSLFVGLMQGIAIAPGISRSGSTISASLFRGLKRESAARYSFLLSIPAILGASLTELHNIIKLSSSLNVWFGFIAAFISGFAAIAICIHFLSVRKFRVFSLYVWGVGIILIYFSFRGYF